MDAVKVLNALRTGTFILSTHARLRMKERRVRFDDIVRCGQTASIALPQEDGCYKVKGVDLDGDELTVIAAFDQDTIIVTLF